MKCVKRALDIKAIKFIKGMTPETIKEILEHKTDQKVVVSGLKCTITTPWGDMICGPGDYICVGDNGLYTCEGEIFAKSYKHKKDNIYTKKPVIVDAVFWNGNLSSDDIAKELGYPNKEDIKIIGKDIFVKTVDSPEPLKYGMGTVIIKGVKGELYGIPQSEFNKIYTPKYAYS